LQVTEIVFSQVVIPLSNKYLIYPIILNAAKILLINHPAMQKNAVPHIKNSVSPQCFLRHLMHAICTVKQSIPISLFSMISYCNAA
jgi:hypothetical protein